jgi:hypothetical protein
VAGSTALTLVHNRPRVDLDGGVRALVDTAGAALLLSQDIADALDLTVVETVEERGDVFTVLEPPALSVDGYALDTDGLPTYGFEDTRVLGLAAHGLDLVLPATLLQRHAVSLDLAGGTAWFGDAGTLDGAGLRVPARQLVDGGLTVIDIEVMGVAMSVLLDTGVSCSLAADRLVQLWQRADPGLPTSLAAVGPGNMAGLPVEARTPMVRTGMLTWGDFTVPGVAWSWRGDGDVAPYDGSLGGNVLRYFALGLDHARGELWVEQRAPVPAIGSDADQVGVTLVLDDDGAWIVGAVVRGLEDVRVGDVLLAVDGLSVEGLALGDVLALLAGTVGDLHELALDRDGLDVTASAPVVRLL